MCSQFINKSKNMRSANSVSSVCTMTITGLACLYTTGLACLYTTVGRKVLHYCRTPSFTPTDYEHRLQLNVNLSMPQAYIERTASPRVLCTPCSYSIRCYRPVTPPTSSLVLTAALIVCKLVQPSSSHCAGSQQAQGSKT